MKFYYENNMGDYGVFKEKDLVKAIYTAWNIEADLYLVNDDVKILKLENRNEFHKQTKLIFFPHEDNELNSELLEEYGYCMTDGEKHREIKEIKTDQIIKYDWKDVKKLV